MELAQLRVMGREVVIAVTNGRFDPGIGEHIFLGQADWLTRDP